MNTTTLSPCVTLTWSSNTAEALGPTLYICSVAVVIHTIFWIQFLLYSSVRERRMIWLYVYLLTDCFLLFRFFLFYGQRKANICVPRGPRTILCYFEATSKIYINVVQSYLLLGLNVSRYIQIVFNRNVYRKKIYLVIIAHLLIYTIPVLNIAIQFIVNWTQLWRKSGGLCDIKYSSVYIQIYNLIIVYICPVFLNLIFLSLCIRHTGLTKNILNKQIILNRRKFHRTLLIQSIAFYSIWLILWSPFVLSFQFVNVNSTEGIATSMLSYVQVALDPAIIAVLDVRFLKAWRTTYQTILRRRKGQIVPLLTTMTTRKY